MANQGTSAAAESQLPNSGAYNASEKELFEQLPFHTLSYFRRLQCISESKTSAAAKAQSPNPGAYNASVKELFEQKTTYCKDVR
eukprot:1151062-Pelagomonas_calceolata.AAC.2